jgi:hypothetical protein
MGELCIHYVLCPIPVPFLVKPHIGDVVEFGGGGISESSANSKTTRPIPQKCITKHILLVGDIVRIIESNQ